MTVKELIKQLLKQDPKRIVVLQKDAEGNGYSPLSDICTGAYRPESTWSGDVGMEPAELDDEARKLGYTEEDVIDDGEPCLVLRPIN